MSRARSGFTLIELLVVIAILAILAAILFPVFASARITAKGTGCLSNLKQIGAAISLYQQDWGDQFPFGLDPADYYTTIWDIYPDYNQVVADLKARPDRGGMLDMVMKPYVRNSKIWCCPADTGVGYLNLVSWAQPIGSGDKTCYDAFHMSYTYHTLLALSHVRVGSLKDAANTDVLMDAAGYWHSRFHRGARGDSTEDVADGSKHCYNVLFADGHCRNIDQATFDQLPGTDF